MSLDAAPRIPVAANLFEFEDEVALIGSRCEACDSHYFPQATHCRNPECPGGAVVRALIGRHGRLYSYTVQAYQPPPLFAMDPWAPYPIGLVDIPEGLRVLAMLTGGADDLEIGMPMELVVEPLRVDADGNAVLTYKYRPEAPA